MSAGQFVSTFYASVGDAPNIYPVRVQPESIAATVSPPSGGTVSNTPDAGPATTAVSAEVGGSTRRSGVHVPIIYLALTGTAPAGYAENSRTQIPALSQAFYVACKKRASVTYLATEWRVVGRRAEAIR